MQVTSMHFKERAHANMANAQLQHNLQKIKGKFVAKRRESLTELDDFEGTREAGRAIRQRALDNLDVWLEIFERNATARGATVLWAETPEERVNAGAAVRSDRTRPCSCRSLVVDLDAATGRAKTLKVRPQDTRSAAHRSVRGGMR